MFIFLVTSLSSFWGKLHEFLLSSLWNCSFGRHFSLSSNLLPVLASFLVIMISRKLLSFRKHLKETVAMISVFGERVEELHKVLVDTEMTNPEVQSWLEDVEDLALDMEDILDELDYDSMKRQNAKRSWMRSLPMVFKYYSLSDDVKAITARMEEVNERKEKLSSCLRDKIVPFPIRPLEEPTSTQHKLYGRKREMEEIIGTLLRPNKGKQRFGIILIVGGGGIGKTTLADHVYDEVARFFEVSRWCCASLEFNRGRIFSSILRHSTGNFDSHYLSLLEAMVHEELTNKKFLVVLDDLWTENILDLGRFWVPFMDAAPGSKFLITTRDPNVANLIRSVEKLIQLKSISEEACWSLFCRHSRLEKCIDSGSELVMIGKEISKKCAGLPLAAAVIGSLLQGNENVEEWRSVLNDKSWISEGGNCEITSVLKLSYSKLPQCLKRCFAFCTIFFADCGIRKEHLVDIWMSSGLIKSGKQGKDWQDVGGCYFNELVSRCFLLDKRCGQYVLHDIVRVMGRQVCGDRYYCLPETEFVSWERARHVLIDTVSLMDSVDHGEKTLLPLRTLMMKDSSQDTEEDMDTLCLKLRKLRYLSLRNLKIKKVSKHIGQMKHLRLLAIKCKELTKLPLEIGKLSNLVILSICCPLLTRLPSTIGSLRSLSILQIDCPELVELPCEIGSLRNLFDLIITDCPALTNIPMEIGSLSSLLTLVIRDCIGLTKLPSEIEGWTNLSRLRLVAWPGLTELPPQIGSLQSLSILHLEDFPGLTELPLEIGSLGSLSSFEINDCPGLTKLPREIWSMSSLSILRIIRCSGMTELGLEKGFLSSLSTLVLSDLELTKLPPEIGSLTSLSTFVIQGFLKLIKLPKEMGNMKNLSALHIDYCPSLAELPNEIECLNSLSTLVLSNLELTKLPPEIGSLNSLSTFVLHGFPKLVKLPNEMGNLKNLSALYIDICPSLTELPNEIECLNSLSTLCINHCPWLVGVSTYYKSVEIGSGSSQFRRDILWGSRADHIWGMTEFF